MADPRRWDGDERGVGVGDGAPFRQGVEALREAMGEAGWVAEDPDVHLLPHVRRACEAGGRFRLVRAGDDDAVYVVTLEWRSDRPTKAALREDVFAVVGAFAELSTHVRQRATADPVEFDVTTGMLGGETPFRPHGHLVRLRVVGEAVHRLAG